ncbi:hypothetical protein NL676_029158 [Syzygium grande]|nr:hypothetical protein NL676_029158 [Syzygium grande]
MRGTWCVKATRRGFSGAWRLVRRQTVTIFPNPDSPGDVEVDGGVRGGGAWLSVRARAAANGNEILGYGCFEVG